MRAVVMAGGRGMRLRPFTATIPKPLVPLGGECSILDVLLGQLRRDGFDQVTLSIGHLGHLIRSYVGDGTLWGVEVDYWEDRDQPLGTMGPLVEHRDELPAEVLVLNGDLLCSLDFRALVEFHRRAGGDLTLAAARRVERSEFGVLDVAGTSLRAFREKPSTEYLVNMGVYVLDRSALDGFEPGRPCGADELVASRIEAGSARVFAFDGYWLDIGRPADYERANAEFADIRPRLLGPPPTVDLREPARASSAELAAGLVP